jgi:hypothetical protein
VVLRAEKNFFLLSGIESRILGHSARILATILSNAASPLRCTLTE